MFVEKVIQLDFTIIKHILIPIDYYYTAPRIHVSFLILFELLNDLLM